MDENAWAWAVLLLDPPRNSETESDRLHYSHKERALNYGLHDSEVSEPFQRDFCSNCPTQH